jgi:hypothetical protein
MELDRMNGNAAENHYYKTVADVKEIYMKTRELRRLNQSQEMPEGVIPSITIND